MTYPKSTKTVRGIAWASMLATLVLPASALAVPASPHPYIVKQPTGERAALRIRGDEHFHWLEDENGFTVLQKGREYVYATLDGSGRLTPTALPVGRANPAAAGLRPRTLPSRAVRAADDELAPRAHSPTDKPPAPVAATGHVKNLVILMRFADHRSRPVPSTSQINTVFNAVGGDGTLAPTGSVRDFFLETSYGILTLDSTVVGWVDLPHTEAYYAGGQAGLTPIVQEAIRDALVAADRLVDFRQFDQDHDGYVDAIAFMHSGYGAEWGGYDAYGHDYVDRIWSHKWQIPTWTSAEGVSVSPYHISPALWGTSGSEVGHIGVIAHETGHFFGLPDLYDRDGGGEGIGSYCLMANSWGFTGDQRNPPHMSAWSKIELGWVTPTTLDTTGTYLVEQAETSPTVFKVTKGYPSGEYLLIENRQPVGFESTMPQGGLAVWHVDENKPDNDDEGYPEQGDWPQNDRHYRIALLQADGWFDLEKGYNRGDGDDLFHANGASTLGPATVPDTNAYQGGIVTPTQNQLSAIGRADRTMSFYFSTDGSVSGLGTPTDLQPGSENPDASVVIAASSVRVSWSAVGNADHYEVAPFYWDTVTGWVELPRLTSTSDHVTLPLPVNGTHYAWTVRALNASASSDWSAFAYFFVDAPTCSLSVSPGSATLPRGARKRTIVVQASDACSQWTAESTVPWITITGSKHAGSSGVIRYRVTKNRTAEARTGSILIEGYEFIVTQAGRSH